MRVSAVFIGKIRPIEVFIHGRRAVTSMADRREVDSFPAVIRKGIGFVGNEIADRRVNPFDPRRPRLHGGPAQAVYAYPRKHYDSWATELQAEFPDFPGFDAGAFGENLLIHGEDEHTIRLGDRFRCGRIVLEATGYRVPCFRFRFVTKEKYGIDKMSERMRQGTRCGIYFKVIHGGRLPANAQFERCRKKIRGKRRKLLPDITVAQMFRQFVEGIPDFVPDEKTEALNPHTAAPQLPPTER